MKRSPLDASHRALGAKMVPFGGWEMPLSYPGGTLAEHRACREGCAVFDVSHLGTVRVEGPGALGSLQRMFTNDLTRIAPGRAQYTHLLDDEGSVLDDIIVWWVEQDCLDVMPNASNTDSVTGALAPEGAAPPEFTVTDRTADRALLAIQGPGARAVLTAVAGEAASVGRFAVGEFEFEGHSCGVAGTGYTGEDGVECAVPVAAAEGFWSALVSAGAEPAGLGARDTLRLEAGLPLHGHELGGGLTPLNAGLGWVVAWDKGDFPGRDALVHQRSGGVSPVLVGLRCEGRRPPREEQVVRRDGEEVGRVTSGNFSPVLGVGIAMAMVEPGVQPGDRVVISARGSELAATVVEMPFVRRSG
ncbi:MAG: glycine cleavage system aminomethyltransferase GcvT [Microthrixaceae bacterium]